MSQEIIYLSLIFGLLVIPRALQRFKIPAPLTCLLFGIIAMLFFSDRTHDSLLMWLATFGISSLFLFAGLEVDLHALRRGLWPLLTHLLIRTLTLAGVTWLGWHYGADYGVSWQAAALLALALLTPSTGFIIDTLGRLGLDEEEQFWVTSKAIAGELLALVALFVVLQSSDREQMMVASAILVAMLIGLPLLFVALGRWVVPQAPGSEFSLLVMVGLIAAFITYKLGVYYLVGAFIAGLVARLLRQRMPKLASHENLHAVRLFATFFVPFYFFYAGTKVPSDALSWEALGLGILITLVVLPLRVGVVWLQRRLMFGEDFRSSMRVSLALAPTLIFTLVLAGILRDRFSIPDVLFGALLLYAALNTLLPSLVFRTPFDVDPLIADEQLALPPPSAPTPTGASASVVPVAAEASSSDPIAESPPART
ncbi:cation:proton antiporter [Pseudoxanthomonas dokdonensis]|uniref:Sodium:proton antiporter n=1 Tax=Pseudoxanthomonas dokdonensis TaxID=344882 RepID=A0A0R0CPI7_9GAMM|nr:cation:proton antiporter [Pseudoxanthomonas dokdonensis]KRG71509.1 sodium:proton antiporter [Pseudoxanthomonas dokdonensis]